MKLRVISICGCLFGMTCCWVAAASAQTWTHDPSTQMGPGYWGSVASQYATCGTISNGTFAPVGAKQTPIDIQDSTTLLAVLPGINFHYFPTPLDVENTGHVVEVPYETGSYITIGHSVTDMYNLAQFHFHVPSEHTLNGQQYDGELHFVHTNRLGEIAVVGVLLSASTSAQPSIFDNIAMNAPMSMGTTTHGGMINGADLLPDNQLFYTYTGSLTTPPCTEGVRWFVLTTPVTVSSAFIAQLHSITAMFPGYNGYVNNNRPIQPLKGRTVIAAQ